MNNQNKKGIKYLLVITGVAVIVCIIIYFINTETKINMQNSGYNLSADFTTNCQGNSVVMDTLNSHSSIWGGKIVLYLPSRNKEYTIRTSCIPYRFFYDVSILGQNIYYEKRDYLGNAFEADYLWRYDIVNGGKEEKIAYNVRNYVLDNKRIIYMQYPYTNKKVYYKDLHTNITHIIMKKKISYMTLIDDYLYCYDCADNVLLSKDLMNGKEQNYKVTKSRDDSVVKIIKLTKNKLVIINSKSGIWEYNIKTGQNTFLTSIGDIDVPSDDYRCCCKYEKGNLYYYDTNYNVYKLDLKTRKKKEIIKMSGNQSLVSFCKDYIVVQMCDVRDQKFYTRIIVFDYNGKEIKNKEINIASELMPSS